MMSKRILVVLLITLLLCSVTYSVPFVNDVDVTQVGGMFSFLANITGDVNVSLLEITAPSTIINYTMSYVGGGVFWEYDYTALESGNFTFRIFVSNSSGDSNDGESITHDKDMFVTDGVNVSDTFLSQEQGGVNFGSSAEMRLGCAQGVGYLYRARGLIDFGYICEYFQNVDIDDVTTVIFQMATTDTDYIKVSFGRPMIHEWNETTVNWGNCGNQSGSDTCIGWRNDTWGVINSVTYDPGPKTAVNYSFHADWLQYECARPIEDRYGVFVKGSPACYSWDYYSSSDSGSPYVIYVEEDPVNHASGGFELLSVPPEIIVYNPVYYEFDEMLNNVVEFDIEVQDNNSYDIITYLWEVGNETKSVMEDYDYTVECPVGSIKNVVLTVWDNSDDNFSDTVSWNITVTGLGYHSSYDSDDFKNMVIDGMGMAGSSFVSWISVIILLLILVYFIEQYNRFDRIK